MTRPDYDSWFMTIAQTISSRATCRRRQVGALIVVEQHIVSTGYNGAPRGLEHCLDVGCEMDGGHCVRCVHAEMNAIIDAGRSRANGGTLYTTSSPCRACMNAIINVGIGRVVYAERYGDPTHGVDKGAWAMEAARYLSIRMDHWLPGPSPLAPVDHRQVDFFGGKDG